MRNDTYDTVMPENDLNAHMDHRYIYSNLIKNVDEVLNDISKIEIQHVEIKAKNKEVQSKLKGLRSTFVQDVEKLEKNAIWDRFTIAFFGETNAGKSTIIESLRISMQEDTKLKNMDFKKSLDLGISELNKKSEKVIVSIRETKKERIQNLTSQLKDFNKRAKVLDNTFWAKILNFFRSWFGFLPIIFFSKKIKTLEDEMYQVESIVPEHNNAVIGFLEDANKLKKDREGLYDGEIIGTGVQDFTQSCIEYKFNQEEKPFTLIDVPGIEGNEGKYETMIMDAVSKAHCIFYVCSSGKLPESGTTEKIKRYLREQTEVYFLLNERKNTYTYEEVHTFEAMHPNAEEFKRSISNQMRNELGEFYKGCYSLQGLMAFCSVAEINPDDRNFKFQNKLLTKFDTTETIYSISQLEKVESLIRTQLSEMKSKIINANIQKGIFATIDLKSQIEAIRTTEYSDSFVQIIKKEIKTAKEKNGNEIRNLEHELNQLSHKLSDSVVENLRINLHDLIDKKENFDYYRLNVSDRTEVRLIKDIEKKMKFIAECYVKYAIEELFEKYQNSTKKITNDFVRGVKENIEKMKHHIEQIATTKLSSDFNNNTIGDFDMLFSFNWEKIGSVFMSIGGMAMAGASLGSVFPGIGNAIGALIGAALGLLFVGIRSLMSKETPESKAKKQINEKLSDMKTEIKTKLNDSNKKIIFECKENVIDKVNNILNNNINNILTIQKILDNKSYQLNRLIEQVKNSKY